MRGLKSPILTSTRILFRLYPSSRKRRANLGQTNRSIGATIFLRSLLVGEPILRIFWSQLSILPVVFRSKEDLAFGSQLVTEGWEKVKGSGWVKVIQARVLPFLARAYRITE